MKNLLEILVLASFGMGILAAANIPLCIVCFILCAALFATYLRIEEDDKK